MGILMASRLRFEVVGVRGTVSRSPGVFTLVKDDWDDFSYRTSFDLWHADALGETLHIGAMKIASAGQRRSTTQLSTTFSALNNNFFSLGQEREFYEKMYALGERLCHDALEALGDLAANRERLNKYRGEEVVQTSLLRHLTEETVTNQFSRIVRGGVALTPYDFEYKFNQGPAQQGPILDFRVEPNSVPPTNVHVLIGSNGVGKTTLLNEMAKSVTIEESSGREGGILTMRNSAQAGDTFTGLVAVSFSAFDDFVGIVSEGEVRYSYVGLKAERDGRSKTSSELTDDFVESLRVCRRGERKSRWEKVWRTLANDPLLEESGINELLASDGSFDADAARKSFSGLSSGHKIVVLTLTRLVELVEEKTLVLLDEPEAHLHPPLLSSMLRALSDLLENRNGVAVIATHSPVVLQEVPSSCVWVIRRAGRLVAPRRLQTETFGEGVGELTSDVFKLEVTRTGFHALLRRVLREVDGSYDRALEVFGDRLGVEARAILLALSSYGEDL